LKIHIQLKFIKMETSKILQESDLSINGVTSKKAIVGRILKSVLFIFLLSWIMVLSSCAVGIRTPQYHTSGVVVESHVRVNRPEHRERIRIERHNRRMHHDDNR
jgi:hypothetical protein